MHMYLFEAYINKQDRLILVEPYESVVSEPEF